MRHGKAASAFGMHGAPPSGDGRALRAVCRIGATGQSPGLAWQDDFGMDRQLQVDLHTCPRRKVHRTGNLASLAIGSGMCALAKVAADVAQADTILQRKSQRLILIGLHAMTEPRRHQGKRQDCKQQRSVQADQHTSHADCMEQVLPPVNRQLFLVLRRNGPPCTSLTKTEEWPRPPSPASGSSQ